MKKTPLYEKHKKLGAKIINFENWEIPLQYNSIIAEHKATRNEAGMFDTSHMGKIIIRGKNSLNLIQELTTNDASKLEESQAQYSLMCHTNGGIIDDLYVYRTGKQEYLMVVNASNTKKDLKHINRIIKKHQGINVEDISEKTAMLALQGPESENLLKKIYGKCEIPKKKNTLKKLKFGILEVIIARTGYTGEDGFELFFSIGDYSKAIWEMLIKENVTPCGLGSRNTLRLEMGYPLYGNELNKEITPLEANLEWVVCFTKNDDFLGKKSLLQQQKKGVKKKLVGFELVDKGIAREHHKIIKVGQDTTIEENYEVTSGTKSPTLQKSIGMAYIPTNYAVEGTEFMIKIRDNTARAKIVKKPFYTKKMI